MSQINLNVRACADAHGVCVRVPVRACSVLAVTIASEIAAKRDDVRGSGTFLPALIDELGKLTPETILEMAKVEVV